MKKIFIIMILAVMTMGVSVRAEKNIVGNDSLSVPELIASSDTTSEIDTLAASRVTVTDDDETVEVDWNVKDAKSMMEELGMEDDVFEGAFFVLSILLILFVIAPVAVIGLILYFIHKNRKEKMRIIEMAIKNGTPIPSNAFGTPIVSSLDVWNKGIKQMFLGAGLAFLLWIPLGKLGLAIGTLILLIGCGNMVIGYNARKKQKEKSASENINDDLSESVK